MVSSPTQLHCIHTQSLVYWCRQCNINTQEGVEDAERAPTISYQAFSQLHASKFPHLLPGSKRICPVCEEFKIHQGSHSSAEEYTAIWKAQMHHMKAVYQERMFESELRNEARRSFEKVRVWHKHIPTHTQYTTSLSIALSANTHVWDLNLS